jgi:hypothetical protein
VQDLTFEQIESADDREITPVDVPEWGGRVYVRVLGADDLVDYFDRCRKPDSDEYDDKKLKTELLARAVCDAAGSRLFADASKVKTSNWGVVSRLYKAASKVNKLHAEEAAEKKGSSETPASASPTASPSPSESPTSKECSAA